VSAETILRRQRRVLLYLKGTASLCEGEYDRGRREFAEMLETFPNPPDELLRGNGRLIVQVYLCTLASLGEERAKEWLQYCRSVLEAGARNSPTAAFVTAFEDVGTERSGRCVLSRAESQSVMRLRRIRDTIRASAVIQTNVLRGGSLFTPPSTNAPVVSDTTSSPEDAAYVNPT
jgi:hypothetical protein